MSHGQAQIFVSVSFEYYYIFFFNTAVTGKLNLICVRLEVATVTILPCIKVSPDASDKDNRFMGGGAGARGEGERWTLKGRLSFENKKI